MKKIMLVVFVAVFMATPSFAQRSVNSAQDAAKKAKENLAGQSGSSSSQIDWLDQVIDAINMDTPASKEDSVKDKP